MSDDLTVRPDTHVAHWTGEFPNCANGQKLIALLDEGAGKSSLWDSLPLVFQFSARPDGGAYRNYHHKVTIYAEILGRETHQLDPNATAKQWKVSTDHEDDSVFHFADTASAHQQLILRRNLSLQATHKGYAISAIRFLTAIGHWPICPRWSSSGTIPRTWQTVVQDTWQDYGEDRYRLTGMIDRRAYVVVYTVRGSTVRIISAPKANPKEIADHEHNADQDLPRQSVHLP